jgi:hypothetical protein
MSFFKKYTIRIIYNRERAEKERKNGVNISSITIYS